MKNFNLFKMLAVLFVLITGINQVWAERWVSKCNIRYYTHNGYEQTHDGWHNDDGIDISSNDVTLNFGNLTQFYLKESWAKGSFNSNWGTAGCKMIYGFSADNQTDYALDWGDQTGDNPKHYGFPISQYDVIDHAPNKPGENTLFIYYHLNYNRGDGGDRKSKTLYINFTIPGFTDLSTTSVTFDNTTVGSNSSKSITYTHYGTEPTNIAARYSITGTDANQFSITALSGTGATIRFSPTSAGTKTATLVINDVHGKQTSAISLSGKTQYAVSYQKGSASGASGSTQTDYKVYGTDLTLADEGYFTRTGYHQTQWNTNASGSGGTSYNLKGTYSTDETVTLYPTWTLNTYTIAFSANDAQYAGPNATGSTESIDATYDQSYTLTANGFAKDGYTFAGWATSASGAKVHNDQAVVSNLTSTNNGTATLYAKWTGHTYTVTYNPRGGTGLNVYTSVVTMGSAYGSGTNLIGGELPTVTPPDGYYFDGWYTAAQGGEKITKTSLVATPSDHTLYAHYTEQTRVYFKNTLGWSEVYVTYDATWNNDRGAGNKDRGIYHKMTLLDETNQIYVDLIPQAVINSWKDYIAFNNQQLGKLSTTDTDYSDYESFDRGEAVFRMDFDSRATMFVPTNNKTIGQEGNYKKNSNKCSYFSTGYSNTESDPHYTSGYWRTYHDTYSGYTLTYQKNGAGSWKEGNKMNTVKAGDSTFVFSVEMDANSQYNFSFYKDCKTSNKKGYHFQYGTQITSTACTNLKLTNGGSNAYMQTTVAGRYLFKLTMKSDGHIYLTVEYPFFTNDYKVVYGYTKGTNQTFESEIIKCRANGKDTISMFIHSADSANNRSLKIYKCTGITNGSASWNTNYATITLPSETASGKTSGVYNFIITQDGSGAASGTYWKKYDGNYYIRTSVSDGGWDMYKHRVDNVMKLSEYSMTQTLSAPYSHYYCRYVLSTDIDITYTVATDYSPKICAIMKGDATIGGENNTTLPSGHPANIRFSWNEETNGTRRAYLKSAQGDVNARYLVLHGSDNKLRDSNGNTISAKGEGAEDMKANELLFTDLGNWVYQVELQAQPGAAASLIARYNNVDRYLIGGASSYMTLIGGTGNTLYSLKAVYDFKTNRLMTAWTPNGAITDDLSNVDVLLIRYQQNSGTVITFNGGSLTTQEIIGAIKLDYDDMVGHVGASSWTQAMREKLKYFISFPFDVNVSDIFGLNSAYGDAYVIQRYAGDERASKGFFRGDGTTTFWKDMQPGEVMKANEGYCVILDNDYFNGDMGNIWDNKAAGSSVYLYFPSDGNVGDITSATTKTISVPQHTCTIERTFNSSGAGREVSHENTDSHWNMMGVPVFDNHSDNGVSGEPGAVFADTDTYSDEEKFNYFFEWNPANNQFSVHSAKNYSFQSMHSYMVQYHGNVTFVGSHTNTPANVAARKIAEKKDYQIELQVLNNNETVLNRAYVELRENACDTFALNEDVYMSYNNQAVNIYTLAGNYDVAANVLPVGNHNVPVCVEVKTAGKYTISMPNRFSGKVTLIDTFNGERTNLAIDDYTVDLSKGAIEDRFLLEINIENAPTAIDGVEGEGTLKDGKAHKFIENGMMYILKDGKIFDARGAMVK